MIVVDHEFMKTYSLIPLRMACSQSYLARRCPACTLDTPLRVTLSGDWETVPETRFLGTWNAAVLGCQCAHKEKERERESWQFGKSKRSLNGKINYNKHVMESIDIVKFIFITFWHYGVHSHVTILYYSYMIAIIDKLFNLMMAFYERITVNFPAHHVW